MFLINISKLKSSLIILTFVLALIPASYVLAQTSPQTSTTFYYEYNYLTTAGDVDFLRFDAIITDIGIFLTGSAVILSPVTALDGSNADFNIKLLPAPSIRFDSSDVNSRFSSTLTAQVTHANGNVYVITVNNYIDSFPTGVSQALTELPTFTAALTAHDTITLTFSENVDTTTLDGSGYTISRGEVTANSDPGGFSNVMTLTTSRITSTTPATLTVAYARISGTTVTTLGAEVSTIFNTVLTIPIFNPSKPTAAITDGAMFTELDGASSITTVNIGTNTYALVASFDDDGVQIIDITNPATPTAITAITDGVMFTALDGASSITTVNIGINTYALVASSGDNGVQIIDITDPATPTATAAITDGDEFTELKGASSITTVKIDTNTYALVASPVDDGVQIIDITVPATPTATAAITDGDEFTELKGAYGITTVKIGTNTYALVASRFDNGVQIIDITNPATPTATAAITDGAEFTALLSTYDITTVNIGTNTYALVASFGDNGVQIIDITDPATPTATAAITDGDEFTELKGAYGITTVNIGTNTYALVASLVDDGVQIIQLTLSSPVAPIINLPTTTTVNQPSQIISGTTESGSIVTLIQNNNVLPTAVTAATAAITDGAEFTILSSAYDITTVKIGTNTYALVASPVDDGVQIIDITNPATPTATAAITDGDEFTALGGANNITTVKIGTNTYALVASFDDDGVQIIDITNPATPTATAAITDGAEFTALDGAIDITTVKIGTNTYALVASPADNGVQIIDITNPATPTAITAITDGDEFTELDGASSITTVKIGTNTYALVASFDDDGVQIIDITNPATPTATAAITDGAKFTALDGAIEITTVNMGTNTYALVASLVDNGVQIIDITNPATPTATAAITDGDEFTALGGAIDITTVKIDTNTYALVASSADNGVQIIDITNPATPTAITAITDGAKFTALDGAYGITTVKIGTNTYALVASLVDNGVQIIDITNHASLTAGSSIWLIDVTLADGKNTFIAIASDATGNQSYTSNSITITFDNVQPTLLSAALDEGTGVLEVSFSEAIDQSQPSSISRSGFRISDLSDTDSISLSGASFDTISASTISITLNESQRQSVISLVVPVLDIESSTVRDIVQNNIASSNGNTISLTPDTIAPTLSITSLSPADSTIAKVGDTITLTLTADGAETGISIINMPTINGIDSTFAETGNGVYTISYTIVEGNNDVSDADPLPVSITLQDTARNQAIAITSVNANIAPGIDANAPTLSITSLSPADSTIAKVGDTITLTLTADGAETGISIINMPTINGIDSTFAETGNGVYTISYTIVEGNNDVSDADPLPVSITLQDTARNQAIAITSVNANIVPGIDANAPTLSITSLSPADSTIAKVGDTITLTLTADGAETGISIINMSTINGIDSTFAETGNGVYTISYTIVEGNNDVSDADPLPVSITLQDTARNPAIAITSVNANIAPGIDANAPTLSITSLSPADSTIAKVGDTITLTLTADGAETGISIINMSTINGIDSTFAETGNGVYTISYTIVEGNNDVSDADPLPVSITLQDTARNPAIAITSITANIAPGIDANTPTLSITSLSPADSTIAKVGDTITLTLTADGAETGLSIINMPTINGIDSTFA